ncbi:hypothetical protein [Streptomyces sp. NPDC048309]|uniref:hypothetical protein n=1 Tax=unclassified Streptomyces TaxID=2593676 RepID=UPI003409B6CE
MEKVLEGGMQGMVEFQSLLRVSNEKSLNRLTSRIVRIFPLQLGEAKSQRYWKDEKLQDVRIPILFEPGITPGDMLCRLLAAAWSLGGPWTVLSVGEPFAPGWEFVAIADARNADIVVPGLEWARISLILDTPE